MYIKKVNILHVRFEINKRFVTLKIYLFDDSVLSCVSMYTKTFLNFSSDLASSSFIP